MRYSKLLAWSVLFAGVMVSGAQAKAADSRFVESRDVHSDYRSVAALRNHIAADRARLNEALRRHHYAEASALRRDIARDQALLDAQNRDIRHDRHDRW